MVVCLGCIMKSCCLRVAAVEVGLYVMESQVTVVAIREQVKSQLDSWDSSPNEAKPVPLDLDPYQIKVLHKGIKHQMNTLDAPKKELLDDLIKQLPESSMQEDSD